MIVPKKRKATFDEYLTKTRSYRLIEKKDQGSIRVPVLVILSKAKKPREYFTGYLEDEADIALVGERFCELFLINSRKALRFAYKNGKVLIKR